MLDDYMLDELDTEEDFHIGYTAQDVEQLFRDLQESAYAAMDRLDTMTEKLEEVSREMRALRDALKGK
jgi:hypothetical protein